MSQEIQAARIRRALETAATDVPGDLDLWPQIYGRLPGGVLFDEDLPAPTLAETPDNLPQHRQRPSRYGSVAMAATLVVGFVGLTLIILSNYGAADVLPKQVSKPAATGTAVPLSTARTTLPANSPITHVAWSSDGKTVAYTTNHSPDSVQLWRLNEAAPHSLPYFGVVSTLAWSPNGQLLAVGSGDADKMVVQLFGADGTAYKTLTDSTTYGAPIALAWSPDSALVLVATPSKDLFLWKTDGTAVARTLTHSRLALALAYAPDGTSVALNTDDDVQIWPVAGLFSAAAPQRTYRLAYDTPDASSETLRWSPDSTRLAVGYRSNLIRVWRTQYSDMIVLRGHTAAIHSLAWSPDNKTLASSSADRTLRYWQSLPPTPDSERATLIATQSLAPDTLNSLAWSPDGSQLATGSQSGNLRISKADATTLATLPAHLNEISALAYAPDGKMLVTGADNGELRLWSPDGTSRMLRAYLNRISGIAWSPDASRFAVSMWYDWDGTIGSEQQVDVWDKAGNLTNRIRPPRSPGSFHSPVNQVAWSPDGTLLAFANDTALTVWVAATNSSFIFTDDTANPTTMIASLAWSPTENTLAIGTTNGNIQLWRTLHEAKLRERGNADKTINTVGVLNKIVWSEDGKNIAAAFNGRVNVWKADTTPIATLTGKFTFVRQIAWCVGGALTFAENDQLWQWQYRDGDTPPAEARSITPASGNITALEWSRKGLLGGGNDKGGINVWAATGKVFAGLAFVSDAHMVSSIAWSPDSTVLAAGYDTGQVRFWPVFPTPDRIAHN